MMAFAGLCFLGGFGQKITSTPVLGAWLSTLPPVGEASRQRHLALQHPKAPKPASAQMTSLLQKTMKHLSDMEALSQKGKEHVATSPWLQSIVAKCEDDWAKIKEASNPSADSPMFLQGAAEETIGPGLWV